jgi:8-oxo-dGTP pyrophosphatase MutT (NUDIX family)
MPILQSGVLAYRRDEAGLTWVCLVTSRRGRRWTIPKGSVKPHLTLAQNAANEAREEAGIVGLIEAEAAGVFTARKRLRKGSAEIEVWVYLLQVTRVLKRWPEQEEREVRWVPSRKARQILKEPLLRDLCAGLEETRAPPGRRAS